SGITQLIARIPPVMQSFHIGVHTVLHIHRRSEIEGSFTLCFVFFQLLHFQSLLDSLGPFHFIMLRLSPPPSSSIHHLLICTKISDTKSVKTRLTHFSFD